MHDCDAERRCNRHVITVCVCVCVRVRVNNHCNARMSDIGILQVQIEEPYTIVMLKADAAGTS